MVFISTNEVFDGAASEPYLESDGTNAINAYGRSKLAAELCIRMLLQRFYIVRTAWLYASGGDHFVGKIIRTADECGELAVVTDEISSPTYAPDLAESISRLLELNAFGLYHFTNAGACSRFEFAAEIMRLTGREHIPLKPITSSQYQRASVPPPYSPLRNYCGAALGITLRPWPEALEEYLTGEAAK
jgi:dTDP-4-dehydrorhamnose reductase